jgi:hypothetical protein
MSDGWDNDDDLCSVGFFDEIGEEFGNSMMARRACWLLLDKLHPDRPKITDAEKL